MNRYLDILQKQNAKVYKQVVYDVVKNMGKDWYKHPDLKGDGNYDIDILPVCDSNNPSDWRTDNIHLNQNGNNILFKAVCEIIGI